MQANTIMVDGQLVSVDESYGFAKAKAVQATPSDEDAPPSAVVESSIETAREALGLAIGRTDLARQVISEGGAADMGAIISDLERAEQALDAADKALAGAA